MDGIKSTFQTTECCSITQVNWDKAARVVKNLRGRIFKATKQGDDTATRHLQRLLLSTRSNTLLAAKGEIELYYNLSLKGEFITSHNSFISSKKGFYQRTPFFHFLSFERRFLALVKAVEHIVDAKSTSISWKGVSLDNPDSLTARCLQSVVLTALEPEWEAKGEKGVYGPRRGRSCHDAIATLASLASSLQRRWVVTGNLSGFRLERKQISSKIKGFPRADLIERWLNWKSVIENPFQIGKVESGNKRSTQPLTPLLGNIFLHGLEATLGRKKIGEKKNDNWNAYIRHRDQFVVLCSSKRETLRVAKLARNWLKRKLISLPPDRIKVENLESGVDFLNVNITLLVSKDVPLENGFNISLTPSKYAVSRLRNSLLKIWNRSKGKNALYPIRQLNPHVLRWSSYFRYYDSLACFRSLDNWMFQRAVRYSKRTHPKKGWLWIKNKYFDSDKSIYPSHGWVFKQGEDTLRKFQWMGVSTYFPSSSMYSIHDSSSALFDP